MPKKKANFNRTYRDSFLFHHQIRVGKKKDGKNKAIRITKFRTMKQGTHEDYGTLRAKREICFTKIGKWLRRSHLDELPQIISWLKGDLRVIGPRPLPKAEYRQLSHDRKKVYDEIGPGALGIEYAGKRYPPTSEELDALAREFYAMWNKDPQNAYMVFGKRILANAFGKEFNKKP